MHPVFVILMLLLVHSTASAERRPGHGPEPRVAPRSHVVPGVSRSDAVSMARQRVQGRVLSAETRQTDGGTAHQIRILTPEGVVRRLRIDADNGQFITPRRPGAAPDQRQRPHHRPLR